PSQGVECVHGCLSSNRAGAGLHRRAGAHARRHRDALHSSSAGRAATRAEAARCERGQARSALPVPRRRCRSEANRRSRRSEANMTFLAPESDETRRFEYSQRRVATTDRDTLVVLEWAVEKARENLRRVYRMRADEECG